MKYKITMTDGDGGYFDIEVDAITWQMAVDIAEHDNPGWKAIEIKEAIG